MKKIFFVAGGYGVGKTTVCNNLSNYLLIPSYSASDLISKRNGEKYGENKYVKNSDKNQNILVDEVKQIKDSTFIINGHFCLKSKDGGLIYINKNVFELLNLSGIIVINAEPMTVRENLMKRDNKKYDINFIEKLLNAEIEQAKNVSLEYGIPFKIYNMKFDGNDSIRVMKVLKNMMEERES